MSQEKQVSKSHTSGIGERAVVAGGTSGRERDGSRTALGGVPQRGMAPAGGTAAAPSGGPERSAGERSETALCAGPPEGAAAGAPASLPGPISVPDPEVVPKAQRRRFTAKFKLQLLRAADACTGPGQIGALLRRAGLYSSHLTQWRRLRDQGFLVIASDRKRGRKAKTVDPAAKRVTELERENRKLQEKLRKAEIIIDFQKKVQDLLRMHDEGGAN